ncbi:hypothetical protein [Spirosoma sordidisoli]|uniref:Uncharacterized protein n=1 Tax=Spirosoma sordidisoli TaxID=2502893 RepID=A0A4Q2UKF9_9BACT|nr:hypothetical protein [Spirosoma sordidisoli]RYC69774.1 hypothetical protein EQG79_14355 [Spirosoma sordidisoli]
MTMQPAYNRKPNTGTPEFSADPINSTYRWELHLTPGHPRNRVALLDGYSKGMGFENTNKLVLLYRKLVNPVLPYLSRCDKIIIFEQNPGLPKEFHTKLLEIMPHDYRAFGWVASDSFINEFLQSYYAEYKQTGIITPVEDRRKNVRKAFYVPELDHSKYDFKTQQELQDFCRRLVNKYSAQCMTIWYHKHAEFQPELFSTDVTGALQHQVHAAPSAEAAEAALSQITEMQSKFNTRKPQ